MNKLMNIMVDFGQGNETVQVTWEEYTLYLKNLYEIKDHKITFFYSNSKESAEEVSGAVAKKVVKYQVEVPEELQFCHGFKNVQDFNQFFVKMIPNLKYIFLAFRGKQENLDSAIHSFCVYMLADTRKSKVPRYRVYNSKLYPNVPYFKWMLRLFKYFCLDLFRGDNYFCDECSEEVLETTLEHSVVSLPKNTSALEFVSCLHRKNVKDGVESEVSTKLFKELLLKLKENPLNRFSEFAYDIMVARESGEKMQDVAKRLNVSNPIISLHLQRLRDLAEKFFEGKEHEFSYLKV